MNQKFRIRPFNLKTDVQSLLALRSAIEAADQVGTHTSEQALREEFNWNGHEPENDRWVVETIDNPGIFWGHAWSYQQTVVRTIIHAAVHPSVRRQGIGSELLKIAIDRANDVGATQIVACAEKKDIVSDEFLRVKHFQPVGNNRHLIAPEYLAITPPRLPKGFNIQSFAELQDLAYVVTACNGCYANMWGHGENTVPATVESYSQLMGKYPDHFFPDGMFVLFSANDEVVGICFGRLEQWDDEKLHKIIDSPGVVPAMQHLGLQRPLLLTTMQWLNSQAEGDFHLLSWGDSEKTAALFEEVGFTQTKEHTIEYLLAA